MKKRVTKKTRKASKREPVNRNVCARCGGPMSVCEWVWHRELDDCVSWLHVRAELLTGGLEALRKRVAALEGKQ